MIRLAWTAPRSRVARAALTAICLVLTGALLAFWAVFATIVLALRDGDGAFIAPSPWYVTAHLLLHATIALLLGARVFFPGGAPDQAVSRRVSRALLGLLNLAVYVVGALALSRLEG